jgi:hypothetical protein
MPKEVRAVPPQEGRGQQQITLPFVHPLTECEAIFQSLRANCNSMSRISWPLIWSCIDERSVDTITILLSAGGTVGNKTNYTSHCSNAICFLQPREQRGTS